MSASLAACITVLALAEGNVSARCGVLPGLASACISLRALGVTVKGPWLHVLWSLCSASFDLRPVSLGEGQQCWGRGAVAAHHAMLSAGLELCVSVALTWF